MDNFFHNDFLSLKIVTIPDLVQKATERASRKYNYDLPGLMRFDSSDTLRLVKHFFGIFVAVSVVV